MENKFKDSLCEFNSFEQIQKLQNSLLQKHLKYISTYSPFYKKLFKQLKIDPLQIKTTKELSRLPFTTKKDLCRYPQDFICTPSSQIVDISLTSGTTGDPIAIYLTSKDINRLGYNEEISLKTAQITSKDIVLIAVALDRCFMAGLAYFLGLQRIGATAIRGGSSSIPILAELVCKYNPSVIIGVPSLLLNLALFLEEEGISPQTTTIQKLICIGEPIRYHDFSLMPLGKLLHQKWRAKLFGTYASSEMGTAFCECEYGKGGHLHPDLIILEIVDENGNILPPGKIGEVVATPLRVEGMPLLRFKTGDIAFLDTTPCKCGRNSPRLSPILGRKSQALKIKGTTVYPPAIFAVLQKIPSIKNYYLEVYNHYELSDIVKVVVGTTDAHLNSEQIAEKIAANIRVKPEVIITTPQKVNSKIIQPNKRKPVLFFDYRQKKHG